MPSPRNRPAIHSHDLIDGRSELVALIDDDTSFLERKSRNALAHALSVLAYLRHGAPALRDRARPTGEPLQRALDRCRSIQLDQLRGRDDRTIELSTQPRLNRRQCILRDASMSLGHRAFARRTRK